MYMTFHDSLCNLYQVYNIWFYILILLNKPITLITTNTVFLFENNNLLFKNKTFRSNGRLIYEEIATLNTTYSDILNILFYL